MFINDLIDTVNGVSKTTNNLISSLPCFLSRCIAVNRSGLSAKRLTSNIIKDLTKAGIPNGPNADGTDNMINKFVRVISENIVDEIKNNLRVEGVVDIGNLSFYGTGANAGGPVVVQGTNLVPIVINGFGR